MPEAPSERKLFALICLVLALGTAALYWPITSHPFILFDDDQYVTGNSHVTSGLKWTNIVWAFQTYEAANWHPLTWISHMADCQMFGLNPGAHHLVNLLFHIANTLLLFVWLKNLTGATWRSAFVAALFAWHPLRVESVAWASERKDVLSAFFWMLTLLAWSSYVKKRSFVPYFLALVFFALGLMSKPMVVTLPFVLLLLDFWPLNRFPLDAGNIFRRASILIAEKIPFFALAVAGSIATFFAQRTGGAIWVSPWNARLENALLAYVRYISKLFWPHDLAVVYSYPRHWPVLFALGAALLLLAWTALFLFRIRQNPYLIFSWLWFLGTLVPTIGIIQVGAQSIADRYTYIPSIGFSILVAWGACDLLNRWPEKKKFLPIAAALALAGCLGVTSIQINYWRNNIPLFLHAVEVTTDNYVAENCLGKAYERAGDPVRALVCYSDAVKVEPRYPQAQFNLAICLLGFGKTDEALEHLRAAAKLEPHDPDIQYDLGIYFLQHGSLMDAARGFRTALADRPGFPPAKNELDKLLAAHPELTNSAAAGLGK
jgi:tetratricopeptide (TPR) repeat protein